jgi:hypothetical protein
MDRLRIRKKKKKQIGIYELLIIIGSIKDVFFIIMSSFFPFLLLLVVSSRGSLSLCLSLSLSVCLSLSLSHSPFLLLLRGGMSSMLLASFTWFFVLVIVCSGENECAVSSYKNDGFLHVCIDTPPSSVVSSSLLLLLLIPPSRP